jgi:membrane protease YdiL (CAAX protease family)
MFDLTRNKFSSKDRVLNIGFAVSLFLIGVIYFLFPAIAGPSGLNLFAKSDLQKMIIWTALLPPILITFCLLTVIYFSGRRKGFLGNKLKLVRWQNVYIMITPAVAIGMLFLCGSLTLKFQAVLKFLHIPVEPPPFLQVIMKCGPEALIAMGFAAIVLAPISEELVFRRFLFGFMAARLGMIPSIIITSFAFALVHNSLLQLPGLFLLGVAFQVIYLHYRSLYPAILLHAANNTIAFMVILLFKTMNLPLSGG